MRYLTIFYVLVFCSYALSQNAPTPSKKGKASVKVVRILNAISLAELENEQDLLSQLKVSCQNNQCNQSEMAKIQELGQRVIHCHLKTLKFNGISNKDANHLCLTQQAMLGCDSLSTRLMRKMCYSGNRYSLRALMEKEARFSKQRTPASQ